MSFELQVQSSVLGAIAARAVQARLFTTCFAPFSPIYIDHVDVADTPVAIVAGNAAVRLRVPVDVFIVRRNDVLAAPNRVPVGATTPAGTVIVVLEMAAIGAIVSLRCIDADLGMVGLTLGTHAAAAKASLIQAVGSPITVNLTIAHKKLLLPAPQSARVDLVADIVSIRFDSSGAAVVHLFQGHEWGIFIEEVPVEDRAFLNETALPEIWFGGARFGYDGMIASPAGMTIGGLVKLPPGPGRKTLQPAVTPFGQPFRLEFCSMLAHPCADTSSPGVPVGDANTHGRVWLGNLGAFGDVEIISPGNWIAPYLERPAASPEIRLAIPSVVAGRITTPVRFIVRTARGVRFIDLGMPPRAIVDADGNVTNAVVEFIDDCRYVSAGPEDAFGIDWGSGTEGDEELTEPALKQSDWNGYLSRQRGIDVQLVTLFALEPNEVIQFRSTDHAIDITADHQGRAVVPVMLPIADGSQRASLIRANHRSIAGHFSIRTAVLMNQSCLSIPLQNRFTSTAVGSVHSSTEFESRLDLHRCRRCEAPILLECQTCSKRSSPNPALRFEVERRAKASLVLAGEASHPYSSIGCLDVGYPSIERAYDPAPRPAGESAEADHHPFSNRIESDANIQSLFAVPGFADASIALATTTDGTTLVLDLNETGVARVTGTLVGPIGALEVSGNWGSAQDPERISVYRSIKN